MFNQQLQQIAGLLDVVAFHEDGITLAWCSAEYECALVSATDEEPDDEDDDEDADTSDTDPAPPETDAG